MCKLCNSDLKPIDLTNSKSESRKEFAKICKEYLEEYPCIYIYQAYSCRPNKLMSADEFIVQRLTTKYIYSNINFKAWQKRNIKSYMKTYIKKDGFQEKTSEYVRVNTIRKTLEQNIFESKNISSNTIVYRVRFYEGKGRRTKSFKTLEEAQQFKKEVLNVKNN